MKKIFLLLVLLSCVTIIESQTIEIEKNLKTQSSDTITGWKHGGVININTSQTSLTNWAAGGQSSVSVNSLLSLFARYRSNIGIWENNLDLGYGALKQGKWKDADWWKTDDKIDFTSKYGRKAFNSWYYAALLNFKTQMAYGYNYPNDSVVISKFLAPGYLLVAMGLDYNTGDKIAVFIAPLTGKLTFVSDTALSNAGAFGVEIGEKLKSEFGGYVRFSFKYEIMENIILQSKLDLFSNYLKGPQNIDVNWETLISMKINKYISASITTNLIYDDDIDISIDTNDDGVVDKKGPRIQFKEVLAVGFSYNF